MTMKNQLILLVLLAGIFSNCKDKEPNKKETQASDMMAQQDTKKTDQEGWTVLFDGTSFDGWKAYLKDGMAEHWKLEDGAMVFYPPAERPDGASYNLVSEKDYTNFVLSLEWKVAKGANSGIFWGIKEDAAFGQPYETGPEIQVLDNTTHPDARNGTTHQAGALYDMIAPSEDVTKPAGEWNTCVITVNYKEQQGEVRLNGVAIVTFPLGNSEWDALVAKSKFANWTGFGKYHTGKIGLQDHGDMVAFRNIKIKEL